MAWYVTLCSLAAGTTCFLIYVASAIMAMRGKQHEVAAELLTANRAVAAAPPGVTAADYTKLLEAASKLTDSLSKAGPTLISLIGAILFFLVAALSSGALKEL